MNGLFHLPSVNGTMKKALTFFTFFLRNFIHNTCIFSLKELLKMARNSEKAMTALARWRQLQLKEQGKLRVDRRPHLASEETNVKKAEKWRYQVVREIAKKVAQIQNGKKFNFFYYHYSNLF
jgi:hypothetical protein